MSWAMNRTALPWALYWTTAMIMDNRTKTTIQQRMRKTVFRSLISLTRLSLSRSMVRVEEEAMTREDRVDMEAERTSTTVRAMRISGRLESMEGITESNSTLPLAPMVILSENRRPKPPRK